MSRYVVNMSGAGWPGAQVRARDRAVAPQPEAGPLPHRRPILIDGGESGQVLGDFTTSQVRHLAVRKAIDESHPAAQPMLDHVFGIGYAPGR
jgi:hypothetical protein